MANEPMPWQLTVEKLRKALDQMPDEAVVALRVPPPGIGDPHGAVFYNLRVDLRGQLMVHLVPLGADEKTDGRASGADTV